MEDKASVLKEIKNFMTMVLSAERKKNVEFKKALEKDDDITLDVIEYTEGGKYAGERWKLTKKNDEAFMRIMTTLNIIMGNWIADKKSYEFQILKTFRDKVAKEYDLRSIDRTTISKPIAQTFTEILGGELPEKVVPVKKEGETGAQDTG